MGNEQQRYVMKINTFNALYINNIYCCRKNTCVVFLAFLYLKKGHVDAEERTQSIVCPFYRL